MHLLPLHLVKQTVIYQGISEENKAVDHLLHSNLQNFLLRKEV